LNVAQDTLFLTLEGRQVTGNTVKEIIERISKKSGVSRLRPHLCRHTFATNYLINGGDVFSLQQILGHTSLEMVRRYVTLGSTQEVLPYGQDEFGEGEAGQSDPEWSVKREWGQECK
jgi:site-specific recombinase XerD